MGQQPFFSEDGEYLGSVETGTTKSCPHKNRKDVGGCSVGCCDDYECLDCGKVFRVEVPD